MIGAFEFEHGGRTYRCVREDRSGEPAGRWWWFSVSHDAQRYAPFEARSGDTQQSVRERIIAYYEHRVWLRAQPPEPRYRGPGRPAVKKVEAQAGGRRTDGQADRRTDGQ
jgi:hypothetical protein